MFITLVVMFFTPLPHSGSVAHLPLPPTLQMDGTSVGCEGGGLYSNVVLSFSLNSMTTVTVILAAVITLIIGFGVSGM